MKTFFKILAVILVILALAVVILPYVFKGKIIELAKQEINNQVVARVDFQEMDFGLVRSFPDFRLTITNLSVVGQDAFDGDTLASIPEIKVVFNLIDVLKGNFEVNKIALIRPKLLVWTNADGKANYDIAISDETTEQPVANTDSEEEDISIRLKKFSIVDGELTYRDDEMQLLVNMIGLNHTLSGDLSASRTTLFTQTSVADMVVNMENTTYLHHAAIRYQANLDADLANSIYTFGKNELTVNNLKLNFDGSVSMVNDGINLVLTYNAPSTNFKELLSLIPANYLKDYPGLATTGTFKLEGAVKGLYTEESYPAFSMNLEVQNASVKYPDLPGKIANIQVNAAVTSPGGTLDATILDIQKMHMELGKNPIDVQLNLTTPISDPNLDCTIKGRMDLATVKDFYPMDSTDQMKGTFVADITLKGKLSSIENEDYNQFLAMGSIVVQNMEYSSPALKNPVEITQTQCNFSPQYIDLVSFAMKTGQSDLQASGKLTDYLAWYLKNETLNGTLMVKSDYFNMDDIMDTSDSGEEMTDTTPSGETNTPTAPADTSAVVPQVPANIHFVMGSTFKQLIYDSLDMTNVSGKLIIADKAIQLNDLRMQVSGGTMQVNGSYATPSPKMAESSLNMKLNNLDIPTAYEQFAMFRTYLPLAKKATGKCNASLDFTTGLDAQLMPIYSTLNGTGWMSSNQIRIENLNTLEQAAQLLHYDKLSNLTLEKVLVEFKFVEGKLMVDPFDIKSQGMKATIQGWTALDGTIGYSMQTEIPRAKLGSDANQLIDNLVGEANKLGANFSVSDNLPFHLTIGGTMDSPTVSVTPGTGSGTATPKETVKEVVNQEIDKVKEDVTEKAKQLIEDADAQAKKIIADAEKQAADLRKSAQKAKQDLKAEAKKQGDQLIAEGKKNGALGEMAAKKAAAKLDEEAENQGNKLIGEANNQANDIVNKAKITAAKIREDAQKEADKL